MIHKKFNLILFTGSYPFNFASENTFISPEIPHLNNFFNITIVPKYLAGECENVPVCIEDGLGKMLQLNQMVYYKIQMLVLCFTTFIFYKELFVKFNKILHIQSFIYLIRFLGTALQTRNWILNYIKDNNINLNYTIFYTYWLDEITMGLVLAKISHPNMKIVSRAHGGDLYEERHYYSYIPMRPEIFLSLDKIFTDSKKGEHYFVFKYPKFRSVFSVSLMGISKQTLLSKFSTDKIFRIATCSYLTAVKRIELLIDALEKLGKNKKDQIFEWVHIGDGILKLELECFAKNQLPSNVKYNFIGYIPPNEVILLYQNNPIDIFINVSSSEGTPMSIMEAQSVGIPVIATSVGGNSEIVTNENGLLLSENPDVDEIVNAISLLLDNQKLLLDKRRKSYENWYKYYNSDVNFQRFVNDLLKMF